MVVLCGSCKATSNTLRGSLPEKTGARGGMPARRALGRASRPVLSVFGRLPMMPALPAPSDAYDNGLSEFY